MTKSQRALYFNKLWPEACAAQGWDKKDEETRKSVTIEATGGKHSTKFLNQHEITALFAFLGFLAGDPKASSDWHRISKNGSEAVNYQRIGEWHRKRAGYGSGGKIDMERFRKMGDDIISPDMTLDEAKKYAMTMRCRAKSKEGDSPRSSHKKRSQTRRKPSSTPISEISESRIEEEIDCPF